METLEKVVRDKRLWIYSKLLKKESLKEVIKLIEEDGWYQARIRGSHRQIKHLTKSGA